MKPYKVKILPSAKNDLITAREWYNHINPNLPKRLLVQLNQTVAKIRETPFVYAIRYNDVRIANVKIFP